MSTARSWIALHPEWYVAERQTLARRFPKFRVSGRELTVGTLAYVGEIVVDLGAEKKGHPVLLAYAPASPYQMPVVFPLTKLPPGDDWTLADAQQHVYRMPTGYARHQMPAGSLCLIESESHATEEIVGGAEVLRRAKEVFKAVDLLLPFPYPDSPEAELEAHFLVFDDILLPPPCQHS